MPPPPTPAESKVMHCWSFLGGWFPERLVLYDALYGIDDWDQMIELLQVMRDAFLKPKE